MNKEVRTFKNENAITLIALIITIIILVILAAVSIRSIYNMGIVGHAVDGTQKYARGAVAEKNIFDRVAELLDNTLVKIKGIQDGCGITLNKDRLGLQLQANTTVTEQLTATVVNLIGDVTWESSVPGVATVSDDGTVTAVSLGNTVVTASIIFDGKEYSASCEVNITDVPVTSVNVTPTSITINKGGTTTVTAEVGPANVTNNTVTWSSGDGTIATVDANGVVTGVGGGTTQITATANDGSEYSASCTVTVNVPVTGLALYKSGENASTAANSISGEVEAESTLTLVPVFTPSDASNKTVIWESSNTNVATVANGVVTGVTAGTATITATANGGTNVTATCQITVTRVVVAVSSITIRVGEHEIQVTKDNVNNYMGKVVQNYKGTSGTETVQIDPCDRGSGPVVVSKVYRLYYVDFDGDFGAPGTIYLKADQSGHSYRLDLGQFYYWEVDGPSVCNSLNPGLETDDESEVVYLNMMTKTSLWESLVTSGANTGIGDKVLWAAGGPSIPLMIDSFNVYYGLTESIPSAPPTDEGGEELYHSSSSPLTKLFYRPATTHSGYEIGWYYPTTRWSEWLEEYLVKEDSSAGNMYCPTEDSSVFLSSCAYIWEYGGPCAVTVGNWDDDDWGAYIYYLCICSGGGAETECEFCPIVAVDASAVLAFDD